MRIFIMCRKLPGMRKSNRTKLLIVLGWLLVWQAVSVWTDNAVLVAGPVETAAALWDNLRNPEFIQIIGLSLLRVGTGFFTGAAMGLVLAAGSFRFRLLEDALRPVMALCKTIPAASFVVIFLIWWGSSFLSVAVSFLVVLPGIYISTLEGLRSMDEKLLEMADIFRLPFRSRFFYIYRPALKHFWDGSMKLALGMSFKGGVAAEIIGTPDFSIGERIYLAKIQLDTAGVFAWTAVVVALSFCFEQGIRMLWEYFCRWQPECKAPGKISRGQSKADSGQGNAGYREKKKEEVQEGGLCPGLYGVDKSFGALSVLSDANGVYEKGKTYFLTGASGSGKTTTLRLMAGLETPDKGKAVSFYPVSMAFQDDRLCENYSALCNVALVTGERERAKEQLLELLPEDSLEKPVCKLSGGMRRRVAVVRAMEADSQAVLLDEPFNGLDEENRIRVAAYIKARQKGRTILIAGHDSLFC